MYFARIISRAVQEKSDGDSVGFEFGKSCFKSSIFNIGEAHHFAASFAHNGYAVRNAAIVFIENTFCVAGHGCVHAVIRGNKIGGGFEKRVAFFLVGRVGEAIGASAYVYAFGTATIAFVKSAIFESAFDVFHFGLFSLCFFVRGLPLYFVRGRF